MKKIISFICIIALTLTGCAKETDLAKQSQIHAWVLATASPADTVTSIYAMKFAEEVERLSNGEMKIKVYENSTLGGDRELLESCKGGDIPFVVQNTAPQVTFMNELAIFDLPMAYATIEEVRTALDDEEFMNIINEVYTSSGYRLLGMADQSFRVMTTNTLVKSLADFKGQKIRTMENSNHLAFWKAINANPTPMAFSEVYIGLQQGTIDAQENPIEVVVSSKLYEQQKYVVDTNHLPHLLSLICNDDFYNKLTPAQQAIIDEASENAKEHARYMSDERVDNRKQIIIDSGSQFIEIDNETRVAMREASSDLYESIRQTVGDEVFDAYTKHIK